MDVANRSVVRKALASLRHVVADTVDRARRRGRSAVARTFRLSAAAVASYLAARALFPDTQPLTGPLTALLVVQVSLFSTLTNGLRRVLAVVSGVLVAVLFSAAFDLTWWSLGAVIAAAIMVGQLLRLGDHLLEVPISAMLVLGVNQAETFGFSRVAETLVGAAVGVLASVLFPPALRTRDAAEAVEQVAIQAAEVLERAADELPQGGSAEQAGRWLEEVRRVADHVDRADRAVEEAGESRRLNPRAMGTRDTQPILRSGLEALEHSTVALRALFRSIADGLRVDARSDDDGEGEGEGYDPDLRQAFAVLLRDLAASLRAFGSVVRLEARSGDRAEEPRLSGALDTLRETRVRLTELLLVDARDQPGLWELRGSMLAAVGRVLRELDLEQREHQRRRWEQESASPSRTAQAVGRLRDTSRQVVREPRRRLHRPGEDSRRPDA